MTDLAKRLRAEAERYGSVRKFQRDVEKLLKASGDKGGSYRMVRDYVSGDRVPRTEFLRAAAELLDVRLEWLATGKRPKNDEEAFTEQYLRSAQPRSWYSALSLDRAVRKALQELELDLQEQEIVSVQAFAHEFYGSQWGPDASGPLRDDKLEEVRQFMKARFSVLKGWSGDMTRWEKAAAVHGLLSALYLREFGGRAD